MLDALTITEEEAAGLAELAQLDLAMARDFAARAQAAEDPEVANDLARSYQRVARSYRQTLALKMRLAREMAAAEREAREGPQPAPATRRHELPAVRRRADELRAAVTRVVWTEYEGPEFEAGRDFLLTTLEEALFEAAAERGFSDQPLDDQVAELCAHLGLSPDLAARWRELPDPQSEPPPVSRDTG